jgi:hypothetical protein
LAAGAAADRKAAAIAMHFVTDMLVLDDAR